MENVTYTLDQLLNFENCQFKTDNIKVYASKIFVSEAATILVNVDSYLKKEDLPKNWPAAMKYFEGILKSQKFNCNLSYLDQVIKHFKLNGSNLPGEPLQEESWQNKLKVLANSISATYEKLNGQNKSGERII